MDLLPESVKVTILASLQIREIARIKLVCREWKSLLESSYFRDGYAIIKQRNLSSPWSIMYKDQFFRTALEFFCERWGFTQSIGSCVSRFLDDVKAANKTSRVGTLTSTDGLILLDMSTKFGPYTFCVANPVLRQFINIPQLPLDVYQDGYQGAALVTNMNNGDLLGYKVVRYGLSNNGDSLYSQMYSSDSGNWTFHFFRTERDIFNRLPSNPINLNGYLHCLAFAWQLSQWRCILLLKRSFTLSHAKLSILKQMPILFQVTYTPESFSSTKVGSKSTENLKIINLISFISLSFLKESAPFLIHLAAPLLPFPTNTSSSLVTL